jgi:cobalamin biosynthesis Co2+ chelatase CbiK
LSEGLRDLVDTCIAKSDLSVTQERNANVIQRSEFDAIVGRVAALEVMAGSVGLGEADKVPVVASGNDYEREIERMLDEGMTPTQTAEWLNANGFKPQRSDAFTINSVHSIRSRIKKSRK